MDLAAIVAADASQTCPEALAAVTAAVTARFGASLDAVLFYGSCLRNVDPTNGLVDVYALVDDYDHAYAQRYLRWCNRVLAPNVFYLEWPHGADRIRIKCTVVSLAAFERGARRWFHSYLWGRFAQPVRLIFARDPEVRARVLAALTAAVETFARRVAACERGVFDAESFWVDGLRRSYAAELRVEGRDRARELVRVNAESYRLRTAALARLFAWECVPECDGYRVPTATRARAVRARAGWVVRSWQGRVLSVLRLLKATTTFRGGLDYAAWKLERHTGVKVTITPRLRRHPLLFVWPLLVRLLWEGTLH